MLHQARGVLVQLLSIGVETVLHRQAYRTDVSICPILYRGYARLSLPPTATLIQDDSKATVVILGTLHFSKKSVEDVSAAVKVLNPNAIMVELCIQRTSLLEIDEKQLLEDARNFDRLKFQQAVKRKGLIEAINMKSYADTAKELGVMPGGEFRRAYQEMQKIPDCKLILGDRPISITTARAMQSLSVYEMWQVLYQLSTSKTSTLKQEQLEKYKDKDFLQAQFEELIRDAPALQKIFHVLVDERDKCLAYSLQECVRTVDQPRVLAVVGMGHVDGIVKYYGKMKQDDIIPLLMLPRRSLFSVVFWTGLKYTCYFLIFSFFYRLFFG